MWFHPEDKTAPVLDAEKHVHSKHGNRHGSPEAGHLPPKAVVFCLGLGMTLLEEQFETQLLMEMLPGFITKSKVLGIKDRPEVCYLHGGYGGPQAASTVETLRVLGVQEILLVGLCGGFAPEVRVGDLLCPPTIRSEEGTSWHYLAHPELAQVNSPYSQEEMEGFWQARGRRMWHLPTVTTDAVYRQTFFKEALWREKGLAGVDMEASTVVNLCTVYGLKSTVLFMVSDQHPQSPGEPPWAWGGEGYREQLEDFVIGSVEFSRRRGTA